MTEETIKHVQGIVAAKGSDAWWQLETAELLPPSLAHLAPRLRRGEDTMDVWFDSGSSWAGVVEARPGLRCVPSSLSSFFLSLRTPPSAAPAPPLALPAPLLLPSKPKP